MVSFSCHYMHHHACVVHVGVCACVHIGVWMSEALFLLLTVHPSPALAVGNQKDITYVIISQRQYREPFRFYCFLEKQFPLSTK